MSLNRIFPCPEAVILFLVCFADMVSSAILFHHQLAIEANPLLAPAATAGVVPFLLAKSLTFIPALLAAGWLAQRRPTFVRRLLRWTCGGYIAIYSCLTGGQFLL